MTSDSDPVDVVRRFCSAWPDGDAHALAAYFTDGAIYHNIPIDPVVGRDSIEQTIAGFMAMVEKIEFRVKRIASDGEAVLTERTDVFVTKDKSIELPVMGSFEVEDGKISAWRDYFDMNQFTSQLA